MQHVRGGMSRPRRGVRIPARCSGPDRITPSRMRPPGRISARSTKPKFRAMRVRHPAWGVSGHRMALTTRGRGRLDGSAVRRTTAEVGPDRPTPTGGLTCAYGPPFWPSCTATRSTPCPCQQAQQPSGLSIQNLPFVRCTSGRPLRDPICRTDQPEDLSACSLRVRENRRKGPKTRLGRNPTGRQARSCDAAVGM
jgi:hypothetical protein